MASTALEEKIEKIRLRNEEIKRRYEEVEADKKNAAKLDALVKPVPVEDWPERKEPPEFSAPAPKHTSKAKHPVRKHNDQPAQYYTGSGDGKKAHNFGDGQGPPPDPKYNFLADSERDEHAEEFQRDTERNRGRNKPTRGVFRRRGSGRDWHSKEQWNQQGSPGDANRPDYEAWRAERNRIDEARISRQRTAEGNWRREWDNDKVHLADEVSKRENRVTLGEVVTRQEHNENEKIYRPPRTALRNPQHSNARESFHGPETNKVHGSVGEPEKRVVIATDRNIKVVLNSGSTPPKSSVMSVKVSPPNIAGTGRVGPRQRPRVMYSSQSETESSTHEIPSFTRQKSVEEKSKSRPSDQPQKAVQPKSPHPQRKREGDPKSPHPQRRDNDRGDKIEGTPKSGKKDSQKSPYPQRRGNATANYPPKSPRVHRRSTEGVKNDLAKSPRAQQDRNRDKRNTSSGSDESKGEKDKSKELLSDVNNMNKEMKNVPITQSSPEASASSAKTQESDEKFSSEENATNYNEPEEQSSQKSTEEILQSTENNPTNEIMKQSDYEISAISAALESDNQSNSDEVAKNCGEPTEKMALDSNFSENAVNETEKTEAPHTSSVIPEESVSSAENNAAKETKDIYGEASGSQEPKATSSGDIDPGSASNQALINCSRNSGLNDSGFIELPSNDSIHDISANANVETSDFAETSVDSVEPENEIIEIQPVIKNSEIEPEMSDAAVENVAESSSSDAEKNAATTANVAATISQNHTENSSIPSQELMDVEKDSAKHSNAHKGTENTPNVIEKSSNDVDSTESEKEQKNIASSVVHEEMVESRGLEKTELPVEGSKDAEELNNDQQIKSVDEKLEDVSINESAIVSKSPNDINEGKSVENTADNKKDKVLEEKIN